VHEALGSLKRISAGGNFVVVVRGTRDARGAQSIRTGPRGAGCHRLDGTLRNSAIDVNLLDDFCRRREMAIDAAQ
jgi:hypothetical protein